MFLGWAQADDTNGVFVSALGEDQNVRTAFDQSERDKTGFAVVEPVILTFERGVPLEADRCLERDAVLLPVDVVLDRIELDLHSFDVHPFKERVNDGVATG